MIKLEIVKSPDSNVITQFTYFQNQIYLGRNSGDLWINDNELLPGHVMLEVIDSHLLIHPQKDVQFYLLNGKRSTTIRKIKVNDEVTIGHTILKILAFTETVRPTKKELLDNKLGQLVEANSSRLPVIESLTKLMKQ